MDFTLSIYRYIAIKIDQYIDMVEHNIVPALVVMCSAVMCSAVMCSAVIYDTCVDHVGIVEVMMVP